MRPVLTLFLGVLSTLHAADKIKLDVRVIDAADSASNYAYTLPGQSYSTSFQSAACLRSAYVTCHGTGSTQTTSIPAQTISYQVRGATLALQLPDGRLAVVNCASKYALRGDYINRRSCRVPLADTLRAEFDGDRAKLIWPVSLDGKKTQSETYRVLAILDAPAR